MRQASSPGQDALSVTTIRRFIVSRYRLSAKGNRRKCHRKIPYGIRYVNLSKDSRVGGVFFQVRVWGLADPGLNHEEVFWCTSRRVTPLNAYSGCIARPWRRRMPYEAHGRSVCSGNPKIFTVFGRTNEKRRRPSTSACRDRKEFIRIAREIYKRDLAARKTWSEEIRLV